MERMEESGAGAEGEPELKESQQMEGTEEHETEDPERGRPSTPKWWRPPIPPETYKWEEMRRQRQKGGYPWTHLDKDEDIDFDDYLDDNLYEPVNPPPLYGNENYLSKDLQQVPQQDEPMIEIPPELDILSSEGLDGLDKPDPHDRGFDGEREWQNVPSEDEGHHSKSVVAESCLKPREARPTTPKSVGFSPETITHQVSDDLEEQEVPDQEGEEEIDETERPSSRASSGHSGHSGGHGKRQTPFDILKAKAANAAGHVKERIRKAIPVRSKISAEALKKSRRRKKVKHGQEEEEEVEQEGGTEAEKMEEGESPERAEQPGPSETAADMEQGVPEVETVESEEKEVEDVDEKAAKLAAKLQEEEESKRKKEEEKLQKQKEKEEQERIKAEEKLAKQKAAEEAKKAKEEEKARIAEEKRKAKEEEEKRKQLEKEEAARIAAEKKKEEEARKAAEKAKKEEEARIAAEKKKEEEARKAAEKAKKEEEARIAAEARKAEEEAKKAAEKARKEEEAKLAAEKKAEEKARKEEEARLAAEKKAEEKANKKEEEAEAEDIEQVEEKVTEVAAEEMEAEPEVINEEAQDEEMDVAPPQTPSGTTKRKYIRHRRQLPEIPNPITVLRNQVEDFKNKLKRSRTPPRRIVRKHRRSRSADASKSPPRDLEDEPVEDETEEKKEEDAEETPGPKEATSETKLATEVKTEVPIEANEIITEAAQTSSAPEPEAEPSIGGSEEPAEGPSTGTRGRTRVKRQPAAEKLDKLGQTIKGIGAKSLGIASQAGKVVGQNMKVVGKDLQKLGSKAMGEIKAKQEAAKNRKASQSTVEMNEETQSLPENELSVEPPKRAFKLRRRNESQERADEEEMEREDQQHFYENAALGHDHAQGENRLLGSGAKDWESPHDRAHSSDVSEEPYSGNVSARDSPPGSSLASSNFAQGRRTGVLEEIDSDEFFLRERGISEGEDADEVNRFLVEELRQAFRPTMASNALAGFDMDDRVVPPPPRPDRTPRKPPRKDKEETSPTMYQTFPPERPKRKQPQGYVTKFMKEHEDDYDDMDSNEEVRGSSDEMRESESVEGDEGIQMLKTKLSKIESEEEETQIETTIAAAEPPQELEPLEEYEDDGRYEPINEGPVKPTRSKRSKPKRPPTPPSFYYNTIAANEWLQELENTESAEPAAPVRKRRGSGKSASVPRSEEGIVVDSIQQLEEQIIVSPSQPVVPTTAQTEYTAGSAGVTGVPVDDYIDEAGYAIVQKDREVPTTIPRKKKKRAKEQQGTAEQTDPNRAFFSMPRAAPRNVDAVPPARPNRTYSTLRPRRPPRSKSGSRSPASIRREGEESRPSNIISLMQGRPLPPPPRPVRSPALEHRIVLDQDSIEQSVGLRHYANFDDIEPHTLEEVLTTPPPPRVSEVDIACQTDPVPEDEFIVGSLSLTAESLMDDGSRIITASSRLERSETRPEGRSSTPTTAGDVSSSFQTSRSPPPRPPHTHSSQTQPQTEPLPPTQNPPFVFPSRLHLHELEVDFIKVNELCAQTIKVGQLQTSQLEVNSMNATGPVCAPEIRTQSLHSDQVNCNKLSSDIVESPSIPPLSFYQLSDQLKPGSEQELCLKAEEKEEKENDSACPLEYHDSMQSLLGNVDSTNDMKSSHVAEKVLDKQLNVEQSSPASNQTKTRKDASVGTPSALSRNVPVQLNNLNQESSSITQSITSEQLQHQSIVENIAAPPPEQSGTHHIETEESSNEPPVEEAVVRGSYTLPYSYLPSQPAPTPITRERSSLKRSQRSKRSQSPGEDTPHVAFGHTSVAQGEVLSVKLSIPVERGALPQSGPPTPPTTAPPRLHRTISPMTETPSGSPVSAAESAKKNVQRAAESEGTKPLSPVPRRASQSTPQQPPPRPPPPAPTQVQGSVDAPDSDENILATSIRLGRAVLRFTMRSLQAMADYIDTASSDDPGKAEQQRANMQVLLCLLLVLVVGLILATTRSGPYITPRWEFLMPPPDL